MFRYLLKKMNSKQFMMPRNKQPETWRMKSNTYINSYKIKGLLTLINNIVMHSMGFWWNASGNIGLPCNRFYFFFLSNYTLKINPPQKCYMLVD